MKIYCFIQARMGSTRLPGKIREKIGDIALIDYVCQRCLLAAVNNVVVIGHSLPQYSRPHPTQVDRFSGPEEPAARFVAALREFPCDGFVRVCADSPFIDHQVVTEAADAIRNGSSYALCGTLDGNHAEGFNALEFLKMEPLMKGDEREHLGLIFRRRTRLTVDTIDDLERARLIVSRMDKPHTEYTAAECLALLYRS